MTSNSRSKNLDFNSKEEEKAITSITNGFSHLTHNKINDTLTERLLVSSNENPFEDYDSRRSEKFYFESSKSKEDILILPGRKAVDFDHLLSIDELSTATTSKDFPHHLIIVVHGIGARPQILNKNLKKIRATIEMIRKTKKDYFQCPIHVKMIDWKSTLCPNVRELIEKVTLQTNKKHRNMLNQVPTDLLFYLNPEHSKAILDEVASQSNDTYDKLKEKFVNIKVSLIGHSLGTVILYDMLTKRPKGEVALSGLSSNNEPLFKFPIENIFYIGSPLGMFISLGKTKLILLDEAKYCHGFYNIYHPNDLIAYRLEPLIDNYIDTPAYEIPYIKNDGFKKHKEKKNSDKGFGIISFCVSRKNDALDDRNMITKKEFKRYDYVLQEGYLENMIESLGIFGGHWAYWDSQDLFYFILKKIHSNLY